MFKSKPAPIKAFFCFLFFCILQQNLKAQSKKADTASTTAKNKELVLSIFQQAINEKRLGYFDKVYAADAIDHSAFPGQEPGLGGIKKAVSGLLSDIPDLKVTVEDLVAEGDKVATRETWKGTKKTTGKTGTGSIIHIFLIRDNKVTEEWSQGWDWLEKF
ncbi:ester cyclase [Flavihumibacter fluvii]|uniref:ester cyclase n=1 Tax=Flavihumibacter fluvii TaxID=2838157 RepID=UPI001BDE20A9|nr:ester cyclase [Flavihumibacter fluvii]ULQ52784.1 ester cyclase [Flavihumibacter fluvii]